MLLIFALEMNYLANKILSPLRKALFLKKIASTRLERMDEKSKSGFSEQTQY